MTIKRAADIGGHFDLLLHSAAGDQGWIEPGNNFCQWQRNQYSVTIVGRRKDLRRSLPQFSKGNLDRAAGELGENFFQGDGDGKLADFRLLHSGLQFKRQAAQNSLQRQFHSLAILMNPGSVESRASRGRWQFNTRQVFLLTLDTRGLLLLWRGGAPSQ